MPARYQAVSGCKSEHPAANGTRERKRREGKKQRKDSSRSIKTACVYVMSMAYYQD